MSVLLRSRLVCRTQTRRSTRCHCLRCTAWWVLWPHSPCTNNCWTKRAHDDACAVACLLANLLFANKHMRRHPAHKAHKAMHRVALGRKQEGVREWRTRGGARWLPCWRRRTHVGCLPSANASHSLLLFGYSLASCEFEFLFICFSY